MYVDKNTARVNGTTYTRYLLRESRRDGKKTIKTTILNITPGVRMSMHGGQEISMIPRPRPELSRFFDLADIQPPSILHDARLRTLREN